MGVSRTIAGSILCAALISTSCAGQSTDEKVETHGDRPDLSWLTGHWVRESDARRSEEIWTDADGALMTGMNRTVRADGRTSFEFIRIEFAPQDGGPPVYIAQPSGGEGVRFTLIEHSESTAIFANPNHDFPTHIEYARDGDALTARIWGPDGEGEAIAWRWSLITD